MDAPILLSAPPLPRPVVFDQQWRDVVFLHWPVDPASVAPFFPAGTAPDLIDGRTYVGLVPFRLCRAGPGRFLPVPYFGTFLETNVRLYSVDVQGRHGVLFRSLDSERLAVVALARSVFGVPYTWARMRHTRTGDILRYTSTRRWPDRGLSSNLAVRVGEVISPTPLDHWLTARWGLHTVIGGHTMWVPNRHDAWPLHRAEVLELDDELVGAAGVEPSGPPVGVLFSAGVHARFGRPTRVRMPDRRGVPLVAVRRGVRSLAT